MKKLGRSFRSRASGATLLALGGWQVAGATAASASHAVTAAGPSALPSSAVYLTGVACAAPTDCLPAR